ncbi:hypothetical protein ACE1CI_06000 [Aerosakkonemataceae cyanobacterium BLCC-F50]|uniref:Uncharacterized protein n=1 Tax=Floridaenema flaviceps BLCC-F50 TaxID=3153642 RepID=A0ABV4XLB4_9CYAN
MLEKYNFSNAKPGRHRGFKGSLIRVLEDGTEQAIELKPKSDNATHRYAIAPNFW